MKSQLNASRGNNSKSKKAKVFMFIPYTLPWPDLHICEVS